MSRPVHVQARIAAADEDRAGIFQRVANLERSTVRNVEFRVLADDEVRHLLLVVEIDDEGAGGDQAVRGNDGGVVRSRKSPRSSFSARRSIRRRSG